MQAKALRVGNATATAGESHVLLRAWYMGVLLPIDTTRQQRGGIVLHVEVSLWRVGWLVELVLPARSSGAGSRE